ncbi:S9 family peptidase [Steroidobacter sp.]|uniref:S9 family peptidase n=1 Tax=Steroidobacter sp. TaxID=1978227 RepID=UPI001A42F8D3|nr:prolyl oligopeptidase family serine peptidase [Steroidobacter sp.]MBL8266068.1 S9 family peptidase [Steroidobacter sp.]
MTILQRARACVLALICCCLLSPVWGADVTFEQLRGYAFPTNLIAAKSVSRVAWTVDERGRRNVWVASGPDFAARQLTVYDADDGQEISSLQLTADGSRAVYVRGGDHSGSWGEESPVNVLSHPAGTKVEIWSVLFAGGAPVRLADGDYPAVSPDGLRVAYLKNGAAWVVPIDASAEPKKLFTARGGTSSLRWSPDGSRLAFVSSRDATSYVGVYSDERTPILWMAPSVYRDGSPVWSPDGKQIVFIRRLGDGGPPSPALQFAARPWSIWVADARSGTAKPLWSSGASRRESTFNFFLEWAAGNRIVFNSYADGWQHLYSLPANGGTPRLLTPGEYMVEEATLSPDGKRVLFSANTGTENDDIDRRHLFQTPVDRSEVSQLTAGKGLEWSPVVTSDDRVMFISATSQRPPVPATLLAKGKQKLVAPESVPATSPADRQKVLAPTFVPATYPFDVLVTPKKVTFKAADGVIVHGQLFEPKRANGKRPAVVYLHGGPQRQMLLGWHMMGGYSNDYAFNQYLAHRGFVVLSLNYRLGPGYGFDYHFPARSGQRGASEYQDVKAAGQYLQSLPNVDANRIGVYGGSYGGYLTAMSLAHDSALFKAGVDIHGVHDWILHYGAKDLLSRTRYEAPPDAREALETNWSSSPVSALSNWTSPVLLITGDDDRNVSVVQTVDLWRRLRETDVHAETLILVDETHSMHRYENVLRTNAATVEFLERFLGDR